MSDLRTGAAPPGFRGAQVRREGRIHAGGVEQDVVFLHADPNLNDEIDAAYRTKYRRHGAIYINMMVSREARSATIKLALRSAGSEFSPGCEEGDHNAEMQAPK